MSADAWIALGANLGDREAALDGAVCALKALAAVEVLRVSRWIETDPVGGPPAQSRFLNGALACTTTLSPEALLLEIQRVEARFGRDRSGGVVDGPRTLDLDLLLFEGEERDGLDLKLPHPGLEERTFVLEPLEQIDPELVLPRSGLTVKQRLAQLRIQS